LKKILLLSRNDTLISSLENILSELYRLSVKKIPDNFSFFVTTESFLNEKDFKNIDLIILDITELHLLFNKDRNEKSSDYLLVEQLQESPIMKLIIIDLQSDPYHKLGLIKCNDFVSIDNVKKELLIRANLLINSFKPLDSKDMIVINDLIIDLEKYQLRLGPEQIELTFKEFELLKYLITNKDKVISRNIALSNIWGYDFYGGNRTVDVHMRRLRTKIPPPYCDMLKTIRNVGYMFSEKI
jgi:two-component system, OmpR family, alkaline phosphatase synthesis response regulator PhoP